MDYPEYERMQELAAAGEHIPAYMQAIFDDWQPGCHTLASLQHRVYKDTDAGISLSFMLDCGTCIYVGDKTADDPALVNRVSRIGFSSIVEGSDAEVPLQWLDLLDDDIDSPEKAVEEFERLAYKTNDEACRLWHEANEEDTDDG